VWICSLSNPVCNVHASYYLWPALHNSIFSQFKKKKVAECKMCVLIFCTNFVWNISHSEKKWVRYDQTVYWSSCEVPFILVYSNDTWISLTFSKNPQVSNFMKICPVGAELFRADGWIDMMKLIVVFYNFANAPKNSRCLI